MGNATQFATVSPPRVDWSSFRRLIDWKSVVLLILIAWLYIPILVPLVRQWWNDPNFSHGFFVPMFAGFVVWQDRSQLAAVRRAPSTWGLPIIMIALFTLVLGAFGAELFLSRMSLILLIAGLLLFFLGWEMLRGVMFPLLLLVLMVPIPAIVFG